jgi:hypothetical protein
MQTAANQVSDDYIRENGNGTIVRVLAESAALNVVTSVLQEKE